MILIYLIDNNNEMPQAGNIPPITGAIKTSKYLIEKIYDTKALRVDLLRNHGGKLFRTKGPGMLHIG